MPSAGELIEKTLMEHQVLLHPEVKKVGVPHVDLETFNALRAMVRRTQKGKFPFPGHKLVKDRHGRLIDGRARCAAMLIEGRKPTVSDWIVVNSSDEAVKLRILRTNLNRRHLTSSQRAMTIAKQIVSAPRTMKKKLREMGTSTQSVELAQRVWKSGDEELIEQVIAGKITVSKAVKSLRGNLASADEDGEDTSSEPGEREYQVDDADPKVSDAESRGTSRASNGGSESKRRGRPTGDPALLAWDRGWKELSKISGKTMLLTKKWRPTKPVLAERQELLKKIQDVLRKAKPRLASG
ncbi:MAG: hypothetical protein ACKVP7_09845 [Hyphomicrobiaceae bacterium]